MQCGDSNEINQNFTKEKLEEFIQKVRRKEVNYYGHTDAWMYEALEKYSIQGKSVCIVGSTCPWYEAMAIEYGASRCVIFEYGNRETFDDRLEYLHPDQIEVRSLMYVFLSLHLSTMGWVGMVIR